MTRCPSRPTFTACMCVHVLLMWRIPCTLLYLRRANDFSYVARMSDLLTQPAAQAEGTALAPASGQSPGSNLQQPPPPPSSSSIPPLKPWISDLTNQQYIFRSRSPESDPGLLSDLLYISQVIKLFQVPALQDRSVQFKQHEVRLLQLLQEQMPQGPWGTLLEAQARVCGSHMSSQFVWLMVELCIGLLQHCATGDTC